MYMLLRVPLVGITNRLNLKKCPLANFSLVHQATDFLIDGRRSTTGWLERIVNILQISHHIFIKLSVCTSMRVIVLRTWSILTLAMP